MTNNHTFTSICNLTQKYTKKLDFSRFPLKSGCAWPLLRLLTDRHPVKPRLPRGDDPLDRRNHHRHDDDQTHRGEQNGDSGRRSGKLRESRLRPGTHSVGLAGVVRHVEWPDVSGFWTGISGIGFGSAAGSVEPVFGPVV